MKAIISSTYDDNYLFFLPIVTWCWNKLGVDVICFMPELRGDFINAAKLELTITSIPGSKISHHIFKCPEHKESTYAQCSRLYAACLDLPEDEILVTSDVDMALFKVPPAVEDGWFVIHGSDLVPKGQIPMCYISASVKYWGKAFNLDGKTYQQCLDNLLLHIEAEHFRGNYWGKDQEEANNNILKGGIPISPIARARPGTQFASNRIDRDDAYFMDRLSPDIIDYHMHRPGFIDDNFDKILSVIKYFYPNEDLTWMKEYQQQYKALL